MESKKLDSNQSLKNNEVINNIAELKKEEISQKNNNNNDNDNSNNILNNNNNQNYGKIKILKYDKNQDPYLVIGPGKIYFFIIIFLNILLIIFFAFVQYCYSTFIIQFFGLLLSLIQISIYIYCSLKNPGYPKKNLQDDSLLNKEGGFYRKCRECGTIVDLRKAPAHCYECKTCCEGFDHHCSWTTKCIGSGNIIEFRLFLACFFILICYFGISALWFNPEYNKCRINFF